MVIRVRVAPKVRRALDTLNVNGDPGASRTKGSTSIGYIEC